ncbi:hypothetical protein D9619_003805 [Psilocybe cf. subviscida]|uniref:F-box domain-containing protein n=1 Tax=Psilocybe cf. subviscida TaxID=2480587 RepID=A0A8H5AXY6_9AGAR|nr:hypothetical protein D9619_003805 [Psilocybe cf. subviscida]
MRLSKRIKAFFSKQSSRASTVFHHRSPFFRHSSSVMDNFPPELICQVFRLAVEDASSTDISALLAISGTCKKWRTISTDDSQLWARINLSFTSLASDLSRAVAFLLRSKRYPLTICLDLRDPFWDFDEDNHRFGWQDMEAMMRMLVIHADRWRSFTLLTDTWSPIFTFLWYSRHVTSMPLLETLSLSRCNIFLAAAGQTFQPLALRQPISLFGGILPDALRRVSFVGVHIDWDSASLKNLEHLELKYIVSDVAPTIVQLQRIFDLSPNLNYLAIHGAIPRDLHDHSTSLDVQISLSQLKSLSLGFLTPSDATKLFSLLNLPQITEIVLDDISAILTPDTIHDSTPLFQTLIDRQQFRFQDLQSLQLIGIRCDTKILTTFLGELHSISTLSLSNMPNDVLQSLGILGAETRPIGPEYICQALRKLHCQDADPEVLIAVVRSRADHVGLQPLEKVSLEFARRPAPEFFSTVYKQLADLGIIVIQRMARASQFSTAPSSFV